MAAPPNRIIRGENLKVLPTLGDGAFQMVYIDPPFNTGKRQTARTLKIQPDDGGDRIGFAGRRYASRLLAGSSYVDEFGDYLAFLEPRLVQARRVLAASGTLYFHIDYREAHYCKLLLDEVFGRENFLNEIIWAYDYGARATRRWPAKHDTILVYARDLAANYFDAAEVDREPYMAPGLVTPEKAARGKLPTDVWWHTIVSPTGREKTGYPTQKPEGIVRRMVLASSRPGDMCLDFFAGSGTLGAVAARHGRGYVLVDESTAAIKVITARLAAIDPDAPAVERIPQPRRRRPPATTPPAVAPLEVTPDAGAPPPRAAPPDSAAG
ncbi:DNA methyltransferase [Paraconexibacter sp. AEG42_29]|uniref:DNA methyltransferase n=1 Tax=Paraconexibacter sp. AEG42_29 TaxID=2997339 RepID=A0AAU7B0X5_9ACTN